MIRCLVINTFIVWDVSVMECLVIGTFSDGMFSDWDG